MKRFYLMLALVVGLAFAASANGQQSRKSPHETVGARIENNRITIVYGRPYTKNSKTGEMRKIWGSLVPYDKIWRLGADEATLLITQQPITLGDTPVPAGAYTLFMLPAADGSAQLLINKEIGQWGIDPYNQAAEFARVPLRKESLPTPVDQFTISIETTPPSGGVIKLKWETTQYSVPVKVSAPVATTTAKK